MSRPLGSKNKKPRVKTPICKNGHNKDIVGRVSNGQCAECVRINQEIGIQNPRKKFCIKGHDLSVVGREKRGHCKQCGWEYKQRNAEKIKSKNQEYYMNNLDKIEKYRAEHPELIAMYRIKATTNRNLRIVTWTDWDNIKEIYKYKPEDKEVDHIIPLQGDRIAGLHVSWNLQYLPLHDNRSKFNRCDLLEASEWYGKILEQAGLK